MKKRLQLVALLLALALTAQPVLANSACGQRACGSHPAMDCCPPSSGAHMPMPMGMDCAQSHPAASAAMHCNGDTCCMLSPASPTALSTPILTNPNGSGLLILAAIVHVPAASLAVMRPPGPRLRRSAPRYLLFRDLRI
jgi:hypothetical protein